MASETITANVMDSILLKLLDRITTSLTYIVPREILGIYVF